MEYKIKVKDKDKKSYEIFLAEDYNNLNTILNKKICIVSDTNVSKEYMKQMVSLFEEYGNTVYTFVFNSGEKYKNLDTVYSLYEELIQWKFNRKDYLVALGGGVVGDLTGYAAATYLRGIQFIQIPTSLLAMVDSSVGGKTGVDFRGFKNMIGAFHQPFAVHMNIKTLDTLPSNHYYNGMAEIIKHGLIKDEDYYSWLRKKQDLVHSHESATLIEMIYKSCLIKKEVVEKDPKEQGERALLNFGHTIGHAVEKLMDFQLLHGECVSIGMVASCFISMKRGYLTTEEFDSIIELLKDYKLPISLDQFKGKDIAVEEILDTLALDKKQESGKLKFILLKRIGQAFIETNVSKEELISSIKYIMNKDVS